MDQEGNNKPESHNDDELDSLIDRREFRGAGLATPFYWMRDYLERESPATFMVHAFTLFFASVIIEFLTAVSSSSIDLGSIQRIESIQSQIAFLGGVMTLCRITSFMLVAWAIAKLILNAILESKSE